jgi:hypothetical protein
MQQLATKENLIALKGELSEKVFNSTMKFGTNLAVCW